MRRAPFDGGREIHARRQRWQTVGYVVQDKTTAWKPLSHSTTGLTSRVILYPDSAIV